MKKIIVSFILIFIVFNIKAQNTLIKKQDQVTKLQTKEESPVRQFLYNSTRTRVNKDWSLMAEFKSGTNEHVQFYPVQAIDLVSNMKMEALQIDMLIKPYQVSIVQVAPTIAILRSAWIGLEEIDDFINFIENFIIPNTKLKYKDKSTEFIFKSKELTFKFLVDEKRRRLTISINNYDFTEVNNSYFEFWTEAKVDNIDELLPILKAVKNKNLNF
jgi:hypothetical protein